jgi:hypothetical protein
MKIFFIGDTTTTKQTIESTMTVGKRIFIFSLFPRLKGGSYEKK